MKKASIVICTYNRAEILKLCLESLEALHLDRSLYEVVVVNNNCTDNTNEVVATFESRLPNLSIRLEEKVGVAHARNHALIYLEAEWIVYIDDDAKVFTDFTDQLQILFDNPKIEAFGGVDIPWYLYGKPIWMKDKYVQYTYKYKYKTPTILNKNEYAIIGIMGLKRSLMEKVGLFSTSLGMSGGKIAYGEEDEIQNRIRSFGSDIWFIPTLKIWHVVMPIKFNVDFYFKSGFALGRDKVKMEQIKPNFFYLVAVLIIAKLQLLVGLFIYTPQLLSKDYYLENWLIDVFRKPTKRIGVIYTSLTWFRK
ncbi:MAG: glycosyltransferase family 2 protein [Saprospiraceae bacterium]|nr:glycosyltransferase family 2 protein [Saprospiraceae bacterium]